ncbi:MAG: hypothetical protein K0S39_3202, partial [Paenibacillus sp.]|nr:hypothetical protein [Paenibacillus sp.]
MSKEVTINSGPVHIPTNHQGDFFNNRLVVTIKNNSSKTRQANVIIDACQPSSVVITLPS